MQVRYGGLFWSGEDILANTHDPCFPHPHLKLTRCTCPQNCAHFLQKLEYEKIQETTPLQSEPAKPTFGDFTMGLLTVQQAQDLTKSIKKLRKDVEVCINGAIPQLILGVLLMLSLFMSDAW